MTQKTTAPPSRTHTLLCLTLKQTNLQQIIIIIKQEKGKTKEKEKKISKIYKPAFFYNLLHF